MLTKEQSLYQVKLILDCIPKEDYMLIPESLLNYIEENMTCSPDIKINHTESWENQDLEKQTQDFMNIVYKEINKRKKKDVKKDDKTINFVKYAKLENENFKNNMEIFRLNKIIRKQKVELNKIPKAKELILEYKNVLNDKCNKIKKLEGDKERLIDNFNKIPNFFRIIFNKTIFKGGENKN